VFVVWPVARLGMRALEQWDGLGTVSFVGLTNYAALPLDPQFGPEVAHSALWLVVTLVVPTAAGLGGAELDLDEIAAHPYAPTNYLPLVRSGWERRDPTIESETH